MLFYLSPFTNPYFNIATEEFLLKNFSDDFFCLYINEPSVIVGKHQNTWAEINIPYVLENDIPVIRRLSGGGTVFHDLGNINYCFIVNGSQGQLVDFKKYSQPVIDALNQWGVNASLRGKSDLVIDDLKFSGNAEHVYRSKVLHHGTLLFDARLQNLDRAIHSRWTLYADKAVRSNRSKVTNISVHLPEPRTKDEFMETILKQVQQRFPNIRQFSLSTDDIQQVNQLVETKYKTWDWNFGYSPSFQLLHEKEIDGSILSVNLTVEKGSVIDAQIIFNKQPINLINTLLFRKNWDYAGIKTEIEKCYLENTSLPLSARDMIEILF